MSHCTKFDFQYTSRKMICRSFQALGLRYEDGVVAYFSSNLTKQLGIAGKNETPAIIAERNGFHYFMENKGAYYELLIEKHNMTPSDMETGQQMADEFKRTYVKEVAMDVVDKLNQQGNPAILNEVSSGYEIKFGHLYNKSILIKFENGRVLEKVCGVKGGGCVSLTEALENMLSSPDIELNTEWTEEYYEAEMETMKLYNLQDN